MGSGTWTDTAICIGHPEYLDNGNARELMFRLDAFGIEKAWVFAYGSIASHDFEAGNFKIRDLVRQHPDRLVPIGLINPFQAFPMTDWLLDEGFAGIKLVSGWGNWLTIDNVRRFIDPVARKLAQHKKHISVTVEGYNPTRGGNIWIPMVIREAAPELTIVVDRCMNARAWGDYMALARIDPHLWFSIGTLPQGLLMRIVETMGLERLLLGSWLPETDPDLLMNQMKRATGGKTTVSQITAANAARVLAGLPPSSRPTTFQPATVGAK